MLLALLLLAHAQLDRGAALLKSGHAAEAQALFEQVARAEPQNAEALTFLAMTTLQYAADADHAAELLGKALELDPKSSRAHLQLGRVYAQQIDAASIFRKMSLAGKMKDEFQRAIELDPAAPEPRTALMQFYLNAPGVAGGSVDKARALAVEIGRLDRFRGLISQAAIAAHEDQDAAPLLQKALEAASSDAQRGVAINQLGYLLLKRNRPADAVLQFRKAVELLPAEANPRDSLAEGLLATGDSDGAIASYRKAVELDAFFAASWFNLAQALEKKGPAAEARGAYEKYLRLVPKGRRSDQARDRLKNP